MIENIIPIIGTGAGLVAASGIVAAGYVRLHPTRHLLSVD